jgi:hypothetical protein
MTKLTYLCITLISAMVVAFSGHASNDASGLQKAKWQTDDVTFHHASDPVGTSQMGINL